MLNKKAAIGLSMNVLVVVIISMVILGGGIGLLYKFIGGAEDIKSELDVKTTQELERLLVDQGKQVALPLHIVNVQRGESHAFGLGILNVGGVGEEFSITVSSVKVVDENGEDVTAVTNLDNIEKWLLYEKGLIRIQENEHKKEAILVKVPTAALKGQYIFNVKVWHTPPGTPGEAAGAQYGNTQKFVVHAK